MSLKQTATPRYVNGRLSVKIRAYPGIDDHTAMIPDILYKYVAPERIDVLLKKRIRFTQACFLNDPFEFSPGAPIAEGAGLGHFERGIASKRSAQFLAKSRICGVLSLTENNTSIPMWAHYAAAHTGLAIGFDTSSGMFKQAIADRKLQKVQYQTERVSLTRGLRGRPYVGPDAILLIKSTDWEYEREWRWLERGDPHEYAEVVSTPNGDLFLRPLSPRCIRQVILGHRISRTLAESIQALKSVPDYRHLELFGVVLDASQYKLDIEPL
jgi:hypothetical protein